MLIAIASGKGGTGKTTLAVSLALAVEKKIQLIDCDVEEPNTQIFLNPQILSQKKVTIKVPEVDLNKCVFCGKCARVCEFNAIAVVKNTVNIFPELCHSCGACTHFCPRSAINEKEYELGQVLSGKAENIIWHQGKLNVKQVMPTPVVQAVKEKIDRNYHAIIDAPPGTSCAMINSVIDVDYCILVTEPTPFGLHDLQLAVEVLCKLKIPHGVVLNRCDIGDDSVINYCQQNNITILLQIPFERKIAESYAIGEPLIKSVPEYQSLLKQLFNSLEIEYGKTNCSN